MSETTGSPDERLIVMLEARIADFEKRMIQAEKTGTRTYQRLKVGAQDMTRGQRDALATVSAQVGAFGANFVKGLAVGAITTAFAALTTGARELIGSVADMVDQADRIGVTVEQFQALQFGMKQAGVEAGEFASGMEKFTQNIGDAARGSGSFALTLAENGVALRDQNGDLRSTADLLGDFADLVQRLPNEAERMSLIAEGFGKGGKALSLALADGKAGLDDMQEAARAAGVVMNDDVARKAAELDDKFTALTERISTLFKTWAVNGADAVATLSEAVARDVGALLTGPVVGEVANLSANATVAASAFGDLATALRDIDQQGASDEMQALSDAMTTANALYLSGEINAEAFAAQLKEIGVKAGLAIEPLQKIDGINLDNAMSVLAALVGKLGEVTAKADGAAQAVWAASMMGRNPGGGFNAPDPSTSMNFPDYSGADGLTRSPFGSIPSGLGMSPAKPGQPSSAGGGGGGGGGSGALEALLADLQTQREALKGWYEESQTLLTQATEGQLAALGGRHGAIERLEAEHRARLLSISEAGDTNQLANAGSFFGSLATITAAGGQKMLRVQKAAAAAEAFVNTLRAQAQVLADPRLGFFGKLAAYATIGASGLGLVAALGGGGKGPSSARGGGAGDGGGATPAATSQAVRPLTITIAPIDPKGLFQGQVMIDMLDAIFKEAGVRGVVGGWAQ